MNCPTDQDLQRLYDDELSPAEANALRAHAAACVGCAQVLADYAQIGQEVREAPLPLPAAAAMSRWLGSVQARRDQAVRRFASWLTTAAAAALVVAVVNYRSPGVDEPVVLTVSPWERTMLVADDVESNSAHVVAANWMVADLSAGQGSASWR